jgi:hypothetical protein
MWRDVDISVLRLSNVVRQDCPLATRRSAHSMLSWLRCDSRAALMTAMPVLGGVQSEGKELPACWCCILIVPCPDCASEHSGIVKVLQNERMTFLSAIATPCPPWSPVDDAAGSTRLLVEAGHAVLGFWKSKPTISYVFVRRLQATPYVKRHSYT